MTERGPCRVLLVGMMGSGKSTIGKLLSKATGWPYVDNDELLRRHTGTTARELLAEGGRIALRKAESDALAMGVALPPPAIVGVAAGTVLDRRNRERLKDGGIVVWLRASPEALVGRAMDAEHRPFVDRSGQNWLRATAAERAPLYEEVADFTVDTDSASPETAARSIRKHLASVAACAADARR